MGKPLSHILVHIIRVILVLASLGEIGLAAFVIITYNGLPESSTDSWTDPQGIFFVPFICYVCLSGLCIIRVIFSFLVNARRSLDPSLDEMLFLAWVGIDLYLYFGRQVYVTNCSSQKKLENLCFYNNIVFFGAIGQGGLWLIGAIATRAANGGFCRPKQNKVKNMPARPPSAIQSVVSLSETVAPASTAETKPQSYQQQQQSMQYQKPSQSSQSTSWNQQPQVYQQQSRYQQSPYMPSPQQDHYSAQTQSHVYTTAQSLHTIQHSPKAAYIVPSTSPQATTSHRPPNSHPRVSVNNMVEEKIAVEDEFDKAEITYGAAAEAQRFITPQYHQTSRK